ncbi:MAG TPA: hypothetical protein VHI53_04280 [Gaiellaceae bacterium]|nr:hypothetical protein [Gaiellaceae bacterium]
MPLQNRVTPLGELIPHPGRGLVYGTRGCLHDDAGRIRRRYNGKRWIACRLAYRGWHRSPLLQPGKFTELFFLDEATAFAAGHRPCALCRREDYVRFTEVWSDLHPGAAGADGIDAHLHAERVEPATRGHRLHGAPFAELPDGAFVVESGAPFLVLGPQLLEWTPGGYTGRRPRPTRGEAHVVTPPSILEVWRRTAEGAVPRLHPSAR